MKIKITYNNGVVENYDSKHYSSVLIKMSKGEYQKIVKHPKKNEYILKVKGEEEERHNFDDINKSIDECFK